MIKNAEGGAYTIPHGILCKNADKHTKSVAERKNLNPKSSYANSQRP